MSAYDPRPRIAVWYWCVLAFWLAVMLMGALYILDYGFSTVVPVETGSGAVAAWTFRLLILLLPIWAYPFAKRSPRT